MDHPALTPESVAVDMALAATGQSLARQTLKRWPISIDADTWKKFGNWTGSLATNQIAFAVYGKVLDQCVDFVIRDQLGIVPKSAPDAAATTSPTA